MIIKTTITVNPDNLPGGKRDQMLDSIQNRVVAALVIDEMSGLPAAICDNREEAAAFWEDADDNSALSCVTITRETLDHLITLSKAKSA